MESTHKERLHIVSVICAYNAKEETCAQRLRNRLNGTRSGIACVPGEAEPKPFRDYSASPERMKLERQRNKSQVLRIEPLAALTDEERQERLAARADQAARCNRLTTD